MNKPLQNFALAVYRHLNASGIFKLSGMRRAFEAAYYFYKARFEATQIGKLQQYVRPGTSVIDVGANIGFFSTRFAAWVSPPGKVIAIEPETENFIRLQQLLKHRCRAQVVDVVMAAAADVDGPLHLVLNPHHPADHRLGAQGIPVTGLTLDRLMSDLRWPEVSLVKIDVQGAEMRVLCGAAQLLQRYRPILYLEIDDKALSEAGTSAEMLVAYLGELGYKMYDLDCSDIIPIEPAAAAEKRAGQGYGDYLFKPACPSPSGGEAHAVTEAGLQNLK